MTDAGHTHTTGIRSSARWALVLLLMINLFNYIDRYVLAAVLPAIQKEFFPPVNGVQPEDANTKMGLLATAFLVTYMVAAPVFGFLADRWRRWTIVGLGVIVWSIASGASGIAMSFGVLLLMRIFVGIGEAAYGPTAPTIISDLFPVEKRGGVLAWFYVAIPVGSALGYILGGLMLQVHSWHWAFIVTLPPGIVLGVLCFMMKEPRRGGSGGGGVSGGGGDNPRAPGSTVPELHAATVSPPVVAGDLNSTDAASRRSRPRIADYLSLLKIPSYVYCTIGMTALTFAIGGISYWMPTYILDRVATPAVLADEKQKADLLSSLNTTFGGIVVVTGLSGTLIGGYLADRLRAKIRGAYFVMSGLAMLLSFPLFVAALYAPFPAAWVLLGASMFFLFLNTGPGNTILANVTRPNIRATAFAMNIFIIHALGDAISPAIIGFLRDQTKTWNTPLLVVGAVMVVAGVAWLMGAKHLEEDTARAEGR
jgi:MFS family permease